MTVQSRSSRNRVFIGALSALTSAFLGCSGRVDVAGERLKTQQDGGSASQGGSGGSDPGGPGSGGDVTTEAGGASQATGGSLGYPYGGSGAVGETGGSYGYPQGGGGALGEVGGSYGYGGAFTGAGGSDPFQATGGSFSNGGTPPVSVTCDLSCVTRDVRAEADSPLLPIPPGDEAMVCFGYHIDNGAYTTATAFAPLIDNPIAVHDMSLLKMSTPQTNGASFLCNSNPLAGAPVWSWNPGVGPTTANLALEPGDFVLAVHYVNTSAGPVTDTSGVRICACP